MTSRLSFAVAGEIALIVQTVNAMPSGADLEENLASYQKELSLLISYKKGESLDNEQDTWAGWMVWEPMISRTLRQELEAKIDAPFLINVDFQEKWIEVRVQAKDGVLSISMPQRRLFSSSSYVFLLWMFFISMVLVLISVAFMRNQIRPIRRLAIAADRFGKGRDVKDFKVEGAKEVRQAGQAFLDMKTRIQRQISQRMDMLAAVSHDLRTPLTRMKLQLAVLKPTPDVEALKGDIKDMEKMIEGYLNFVRGEGQETATMCDLAEMLRELAAGMARQGARVEIDLGMFDLHVPLKPVAFKRCLSNILTNAAKYADTIWLSLSLEDDERVDILIEDNGPGISPDQYEAVFKPFYRVDTSRNTETGGVGLGLAIAADIVLAHGGRIWLDKSKYGGLAVHVSLPL